MIDNFLFYWRNLDLGKIGITSLHYLFGALLIGLFMLVVFLGLQLLPMIGGWLEQSFSSHDIGVGLFAMSGVAALIGFAMIFWKN